MIEKTKFNIKYFADYFLKYELIISKISMLNNNYRLENMYLNHLMETMYK